MLKKKHYTTPLIQSESRPPLKEASVQKPSFFRILWILAKLAGPLVMALRVRFSTRLTSADLALAIRNRLEDMGGIWIKVGQVLGMRTDLFSLEFCTILSQLQDRAFAVPPEQALPLIRQRLGRPIEAVFEGFESRPVAAASLAQVYKALLRGPRVLVAVKLLRPYAREYFCYDFAWLRRYVLMLNWFGVTPHMRWKEMVIEIQTMMEEEMDYRIEAASMKKMRKQLREHKVYVPKVFLEHSSDGLLVMEYLDGVFMSDYASVKNSDPTRLRVWEKENEIEPKKVARRLLDTLLRQSYEDHRFHGDLHPGNIVLLRRNRIAFIDFGSIGQLDEQFAEQFEQYIRSQAEGNFSRAADILLIMSGRLPLVDTDEVKGDLVRALRSQATRSGTPGLSFHERSMTFAQAEINRVAGEYCLPVNWSLLRLARTFGAADVNFGILNPDFDNGKETARYYRKSACRRTVRRLRAIPRTLDHVIDVAHLLGPYLLQKLYQFDGFLTTGKKVASFLLWLLWMGVNVGGLFLFWVYVYQHHSALVSRFHLEGGWLASLAKRILFLPSGEWFGIFVVLLYAQYRLVRFIQGNKRLALRLSAIETSPAER